LYRKHRFVNQKISITPRSPAARIRARTAEVAKPMQRWPSCTQEDQLHERGQSYVSWRGCLA
jgi:hypothetical protein